MSAEGWFNDNGVARRFRDAWFNDNGVARQVKEIWMNDNGVARCIYRLETIGIHDALVISVRFQPQVGSAVYELGADGFVRHFNVNTVIDTYPWLIPQGNQADYECRATLVSGALTSGTLNVWQALSGNRSWRLTNPTNNSQTCVITVEIRRIGDTAIAGSAAITLRAESEDTP